MVLMVAPVRADSVGRWRPFIAEASVRFGIPERWIVRVMRAESGGETTRNGQPTISRAGAMGLMQLMPATWARLREQLGLGSNPHDPRDNIIAGTAYLRQMYDRFGYPGLFAAYNAGPARYADHLATGKPLPGETRAYLAIVTDDEVTGHPGRATAPPRPVDPLFVVRREAHNDAASRGPVIDESIPSETAREARPAELFVKLTPR
jgi:soluble lytic murein transglycosylase-like protein